MDRKLILNKIYFFTFLIILVLFHNQKTLSAGSNWVDYEQGKVRLIAEKIKPGNSEYYLGLHFDMIPGWKIFWRSPGEAGYPLEFKDLKSKNIFLRDIEWPYPERFNFSGIYTYGYSNEVVLPIKLEIIDQNLDANVSLEINFLTCSNVCIPKQVVLTLPLNKENLEIKNHTENIKLLNNYINKIPNKVESSLLNKKIYFVPKSDKSVLKIKIDSKQGFNKPDIFLEAGIELNLDKPKFNYINNNQQLEIELPIKNIGNLNIEDLLNQPTVVTFINFGKAVEYNLNVEIIGNEHSSSKKFWVIILFSIIGGFVLNFMPCVLPILSLKVISLLDKDLLKYKFIRLSFLSNILGVISAFLILALLIITFRFFGINLGWGFHFQEPIFTIIILLIILIFSLSLFDLIHIRLPYWISSSLSKNTHNEDSNNLKLSFCNGLFATVLATPCTAPIIGTTITFALQNSSLKVLLIFAAMGLGMSLPLIIFAIFPNLITLIPKPGKWTIYLKKFLGFLLMLTALWLFIVLINQIDLSILLLILGLISLGFLILTKGESLHIRMKNIFFKIIILIIVSIIIFPIVVFFEKGNRETTASLSYLNTSDLNKYLSNGKIVFVDVTAEWCITCKVNKYLVLETNEVKKFFKNEDVIYIEIDWTKRDTKILDFINSFDRSGIPLNIVYGKIAPKGIALPEILTKESIYRVIQIAKGSKIVKE